MCHEPTALFEVIPVAFVLMFRTPTFRITRLIYVSLAAVPLVKRVNLLPGAFACGECNFVGNTGQSLLASFLLSPLDSRRFHKAMLPAVLVLLPRPPLLTVVLSRAVVAYEARADVSAALVLTFGLHRRRVLG